MWSMCSVSVSRWRLFQPFLWFRCCGWSSLKGSWNPSDPPWQDLLSGAGVKPISHSQRYAPGTLRHCPFSQRFMFSAHSSTSVEEVNYTSLKFQIPWHTIFFSCVPRLNPLYWFKCWARWATATPIHLHEGTRLDGRATYLTPSNGTATSPLKISLTSAFLLFNANVMMYQRYNITRYNQEYEDWH